MVLTRLFNEFFNSEKAGGLILIAMTVVSLLLANSAWQGPYVVFWDYDLAGHSIVHWINEGLMVFFFLLIGLELEREIYIGELNDLKNASLPIFGAIGGMLVPALLYVSFNVGTDLLSGAGIPMGTDIAFAIGLLSLLGKRVPVSLKVFLTALAVIDDLGSILIIAFVYSGNVVPAKLFITLGIFALLLLLNRLKVRNLIPYLAGGIAMWYFMSKSGIHATLAGVLLAFVVPFGNGGEKSPSYILQHWLHKPVAFFILPLFALANTSITLGGDWASGLVLGSSLGIMAGLLVGKPLGIWFFSYVSVRLGLSFKPAEIRWKHIVGVGMLGGIGFTMSIFITLLAFDDASLINISKIAILTASLVSGTIGLIFLSRTLKESSLTDN